MINNKYHGKVLRYRDSMTPDEKRALQNALPKRSEFLIPDQVARIKKDIISRKDLFFHPNDIIEQHYSVPYEYEDYNNNLITKEKLMFKLVLVGITEDGNKAAVVLNNIDVFFDLRTAPGADPNCFESEMRMLLKENQIYPSRVDRIQLKPFKLFNENKQNYLRFHFNTLYQRKKAINLLRWTPFNPEKPWQKNTVIHYTMRNGSSARLNDHGTAKIETANDDLSCYYRKAAREYKFHLAGWNIISGYKFIRNNKYVKRYSVPYVFEIDVKNISSAASAGINMQSPEYKHLLKDRSMISGWDLETFAPVSRGSAPEPDKVFDANGNDQDVIFLDSVPFMWYWDTEELVRIAITEMPAPPRSDCLIIQCDHQTEIIKIKALILERMAPEFLVGFNDGSYDWPFVLRRAEEYDSKKHTRLTEFMKKHMSVIPYTDDTKKYTIKGRHDEKIKLEATQFYEHETFKVPGTITLDVRGIFMQMFPKAEKSNLNFFLAANKLGSKEDMPYQTMFKIYRLLRHIRKIINSSEWNDIWNYATQLIKKHGAEHVPFANLRSVNLGDLESVDDSSYNIDKLSCLDIMHLLGGAEAGGPANMGATQVVHYCNIDARRCCDLMRIRNVITDRREVGNLSYTSMYDAFYRAGGMKVRNLVMAYACKPEWDLACPNISSGIKDERKYPGAYVVPPIKGLARDHKIVKRKRRAVKRSQKYISSVLGSFDNAVSNDQNKETPIHNATVSPDHVDFESDLLSPKHELRKAAVNAAMDQIMSLGQGRILKDENDVNDRPLTGLDFSSLYPSLMMTYNLSPEKVVLVAKRMRHLQAKGYQFLHVKFRYGLKDQEEDQKEIVEAWIVQHNHPARAMIQEEVAQARARATGQQHWSKFVKSSVIEKATELYKNTSLDNWREYNMGLYPYILKDLYDRRSRIKKIMGRYAEPQEFLSNVYKIKKLTEIAEMPLADQQEFIRKTLDDEILLRQQAYEKSGKSYHKGKLHVIKEISEFFEANWLRESSSAEFSGMQITQINNEINFKVGYYNTNQLALKVYMNTFYGETGNQLSPFFLIAVAGGITSWGQYNTRMIKDFVIGEGFQVLYGDTDSLYICPPERYFAELDSEYESGKITRLYYWTRMVEITMEVLDKFKDAVNNLLMLDNSSPFLKMAYEEVLWPYVLSGKKKYIGIAHEGIVNLYPCMPECSLEEFMASKLVFIRGLEIIKRGSSDFLKTVCMGVFKQAFCITETRTLKQIVENKLKEVSTTEWDPNMFAKSAKYKLPDPGKPGNTSVLNFIKRMNEAKQENPQLSIELPEVGDRFKYVMSKKYPYKYDIRGNQKNISKADQYEFLTSMDNQEYQKIYGEITIDMDYYIKNEIIGQFARFIIYHSDYEDPDTPFNEGMTDDEYKEADQKAHNFAKKQLIKFYNSRYATKYAKKGKILKSAFKTVSNGLQQVLTKTYGNAAEIFSLTGNITTDFLSEGVSVLDQNVQHQVFEKIRETAEKLAEKHVKSIPITSVFKGVLNKSISSLKILKDYNPSMYEIYAICITATGSYYRKKQQLLHVKETEALTSLRKQLPRFQKVHELKLNDLEKTMFDKLKQSNINGIGNTPINPGDSDELQADLQVDSKPNEFGYVEFNAIDYPGIDPEDLAELEAFYNEDPHAHIVDKFYKTFIQLVSVYQQKKELERFRDDLRDLKTLSADSKAMPISVQKRDLENEFLEWMRSDSGGNYTIKW